MNKYTIIPSSQEYKAAPSVDQDISITLEQQSQQMVEYDRSQSISLAQVFDDERQGSEIFRPTFKVNYLYDNTYTGTTEYVPFKNTLYYVDTEQSYVSGIWKGFPQYYEFDFTDLISLTNILLTRQKVLIHIIGRIMLVTPKIMII